MTFIILGSFMKTFVQFALGILFLTLSVAFLVFTVQFKRRSAFWMEIGMWLLMSVTFLIPELVKYMDSGKVATILFGVSSVLMIVTKVAIQPMTKKVNPELAGTTQMNIIKDVKEELLDSKGSKKNGD